MSVTSTSTPREPRYNLFWISSHRHFSPLILLTRQLQWMSPWLRSRVRYHSANILKESLTLGELRLLSCPTAWLGKVTLLINTDHPHTTCVVLTLVQPYHNRGHDLYVDRFYSSPLLATELSKVGITITGTVQCNRKGLPKDVTAKKTRNRLELWRQLAQETYLSFHGWTKGRSWWLLPT